MAQVQAMFIKRLIYFGRKWTSFIPQLVIPVKKRKGEETEDCS